ncbi:restriction endonuclease subunit S [Staphylococcus capitis]|uniref:restriction endonuclease subunit S n=1 Tax=Staphylococcus capitis TaxID=29388 RepID=UPI0028791295|nr:restriction endonuclease subunit S [Staphylococcus capitis]MDS4067434.1 restriction endonuclease subunit S [Staphylococcus capitis]
MESKIKKLCKINKNSIKKDNYPNIIEYLDTKNLVNGEFKDIIKLNRISDKIPSRAKRIVQKNDILISTVRPNQKHFGFITNKQSNYIVSTGFAVITPNQNLVNPYYLYKYLTLEKVTNYLQNIAENSTSAYPSIKPSILGELSIDLPSRSIQNFIANIFKKIDDKIEINKKIIANLEELSQTIFKHWFIDFEFPNQRNSPYNYNRKETSKDLPHGWKWEKLNHLFKINYGKNLPTKNLLDTGYPVYGGNGKIGYYSNYMYDDPKILISCRGAASGAIHVSQEHSFITNNSIVLDEIEKEYFYYFKELFSRETFKRYTTGSAQPQITIVNIKELKFLVPPKSLVIEFNKHQKPIFDFNSKLKQENSKLKSLRDTLLPKLMSGEIEIPDDIEVNMDELSI